MITDNNNHIISVKIFTMNHIPTKLSKSDFEVYILPFLTVAKRGFVSEISLHLIFNAILYKLYTGCQWKSLPTENFSDSETGKTLTPGAIYHHYRKWCKDESFLYVFKASLVAISLHLNISEINLDGTHTIAKKGGQKVDYQRRKRANTSNIFPLTDKIGNIIGFLPLTAGNHNDAFDLTERLQDFFNWMRSCRLSFKGAYFNADKAFDVRAARKVCFNNGVIPNIKENPRGRKKVKKGRKRLFNEEIYQNRFVCERTYAWVDKFKALLMRMDKKADFWLGANLIAFSMVNFRHIIK